MMSASRSPRSRADLLTQVARGDVHAFERLYDDLAGGVLGVTRLMLNDRAQAEQVSSQVWLDVWRQAAWFDARHEEASTWVLAMAQRRARDQT